MSLDLYNPNVPRVFIAEARRTNAEGAVKPSYLVAMVSMAMLMEFWQHTGTLEPGYAGSEESSIVGQWGGIGLNRQRRVDCHLTGDDQVKFESLKSSLKTSWLDLVELGDVFVAPAKAHVVLGSKAFIAGKGREVATRLKLESAEYSDIERALEVREEGGDVILLGPFLTGFGGSLSL